MNIERSSTVQVWSRRKGWGQGNFGGSVIAGREGGDGKKGGKEAQIPPPIKTLGLRATCITCYTCILEVAPAKKYSKANTTNLKPLQSIKIAHLLQFTWHGNG